MTRGRVRLDAGGLRRVRATLPGALREAAHALARAVAADVAASFGDASPSAPGTPPAVVTGALRASVRAEATPGGARVLAGGASAPYAATLEFGGARVAARPFLLPGLLGARGARLALTLRRDGTVIAAPRRKDGGDDVGTN